jgi:hypothetical protein
MTNLDRTQLIQDVAFQNQILGSLIAQCYSIWAEDPSVTGHDLRMTYANSVLLRADLGVQAGAAMLPYLCGNSAILANVDGPVLDATGTRFVDADVDTIVTSLIDFMAGVTGVPPSMPSIVAGDVVQTNARSTGMTVESVAIDNGKGEGPCATCIWFDNSTEVRRDVFLITSLWLSSR